MDMLPCDRDEAVLLKQYVKWFYTRIELCLTFSGNIKETLFSTEEALKH